MSGMLEWIGVGVEESLLESSHHKPQIEVYDGKIPKQSFSSNSPTH